MKLLIILILCLLATVKVTLQATFAKKNVQTAIDGVFFNGLVFLFSALVFFKNAFVDNLFIPLFGLAFGILTVAFQIFYIKAMSCGNVSLTVLIVNLSMIIPIIVSVIFYNGRLNLLKIIGIILTITALSLNINKCEKSDSFKKWFLFALLASFANAVLSVCQQIFGRTQWAGASRSFVAWSYITAATASVCIYTVMKLKGNGISFKIKPYVFGIALCTGAVLGVFQVLNTYAVATIDSVLLFPTYNGGTLVLSSLFGVLLLKDKLKLNQIISLFIGVVAIIIMNI